MEPQLTVHARRAMKVYCCRMCGYTIPRGSIEVRIGSFVYHIDCAKKYLKDRIETYQCTLQLVKEEVVVLEAKFHTRPDGDIGITLSILKDPKGDTNAVHSTDEGKVCNM